MKATRMMVHVALSCSFIAEDTPGWAALSALELPQVILSRRFTSYAPTISSFRSSNAICTGYEAQDECVTQHVLTAQSGLLSILQHKIDGEMMLVS